MLVVVTDMERIQGETNLGTIITLIIVGIIITSVAIRDMEMIVVVVVGQEEDMSRLLRSKGQHGDIHPQLLHQHQIITHERQILDLTGIMQRLLQLIIIIINNNRSNRRPINSETIITSIMTVERISPGTWSE